MRSIRCTEGASRGAASSQVRWETGTIALMLLDCAVTLQPASVEDQMALAIDGEIFQDALGVEIGADSEIVLIPKIAGG